MLSKSDGFPLVLSQRRTPQSRPKRAVLVRRQSSCFSGVAVKGLDKDKAAELFLGFYGVKYRVGAPNKNSKVQEVRVKQVSMGDQERASWRRTYGHLQGTVSHVQDMYLDFKDLAALQSRKLREAFKLFCKQVLALEAELHRAQVEHGDLIWPEASSRGGMLQVRKEVSGFRDVCERLAVAPHLDAVQENESVERMYLAGKFSVRQLMGNLEDRSYRVSLNYDDITGGFAVAKVKQSLDDGLDVRISRLDRSIRGLQELRQTFRRCQRDQYSRQNYDGVMYYSGLERKTVDYLNDHLRSQTVFANKRVAYEDIELNTIIFS